MGEALSYEAALRRVLDSAAPGPAETVPFSAAAGRVLAEPLVADRTDPPALKSAMDGFALRAADTASAAPERPLRFRFRGVVAAGQVPAEPLPPSPNREPGHGVPEHCAPGHSVPGHGASAEFPAVRIMTGALLPSGADAVVKQEDTQPFGADGFLLRKPLRAGDHVIPPGARMERGETLLEAGAVLGPQAIGILAAAHRGQVRVYRRPEVAVLAIGDELVAPGQPLAPGKFPVTNLHVVADLARRYGATVRSLGIAPDDPERIFRVLQSCLAPAAGAHGPPRCDLILTLGGTLRGDFDFVHAVLERAGATLHFDRVRMTPAGSTIFATHGDSLLFGLPGTPVAAWVAFEVLARPALAKLAGRSELGRPQVAARLEGALESTGGRAGFVPCRLEFGRPAPVARPIVGRHPHEAPASLRADGLIRCAETGAPPQSGDWVIVEWLAD
jgi:molybdopterin molybdotransferase